MTLNSSLHIIMKRDLKFGFYILFLKIGIYSYFDLRQPKQRN